MSDFTTILVLAAVFLTSNGLPKNAFQLQRFTPGPTCDPRWITIDSLKVQNSGGEPPRLMGTVEVLQTLTQNLLIQVGIRKKDFNFYHVLWFGRLCEIIPQMSKQWWLQVIPPPMSSRCPVKQGKYKVLNLEFDENLSFMDGDYQLSLTLKRGTQILCEAVLHFGVKRIEDS
ncbi:uncharacterized protein LOC134221491 [Armigeres subalbatus]|uniref:uncharacterized protein LOC134221491 n=1 Tax=Armigeres subalbatus TaxID=124917 RepID=UPI002ED04B66